MSDSGRPIGECTHGYPHGTCQICTLQAENARLKTEIENYKIILQGFLEGLHKIKTDEQEITRKIEKPYT